MTRKHKADRQPPENGRLFNYDEERLFRFLSLRIRHLIARGYTQKEIAHLGGVDAGVVSRLKTLQWRHGRKPADQNAIQRLWTDGLGIPCQVYPSFIWDTHVGWDTEPTNGDGDYLVTDGNGDFDTAILARGKWLGLRQGKEVKFMIPVANPGVTTGDKTT